MVLHHKKSQTVKIKINRHTNIYLLMNLFSINQFIFIFSCISALLSFIQQKSFFNHFVFLLSLIVWDFLWCKSIIFKEKTWEDNGLLIISHNCRCNGLRLWTCGNTALWNSWTISKTAIVTLFSQTVTAWTGRQAHIDSMNTLPSRIRGR